MTGPGRGTRLLLETNNSRNGSNFDHIVSVSVYFYMNISTTKPQLWHWTGTGTGNGAGTKI